jgi:hypothetical protein
MSLSPFFASDTTAAFLGVEMIIVIIITTGIGLVSGGAAIALNWKVARRSWWGLLLGLAPLLFAAFALTLSFLIQGEPTIAGFPNRVLIPISVTPGY